jgi:microcystin-dependent protein
MLELFDIILFIASLVIIYLLYKTRNKDKDTFYNVNDDVNQQYTNDTNSIINISKIADSIIKNNYLNLKNIDTTVINNLTLKGTDFNINSDINTIFMDIFPRYFVIAYNNTTIPLGWAPCDGNKYSYDNDGKIILDPTNGIQTPDLRGRFVLGQGQGPGLLAREFNYKHGKEKVTLVDVNLPPHTHSGLYNIGDNDWDGCGGPGNKCCGGTRYLIQANGGNLVSTGSSTNAHENMPPFHVLYYIMKL